MNGGGQGQGKARNGCCSGQGARMVRRWGPHTADFHPGIMCDPKPICRQCLFQVEDWIGAGNLVNQPDIVKAKRLVEVIDRKQIIKI